MRTDGLEAKDAQSNGLVDESRSVGVPVEFREQGNPASVAPIVARTAHRVVQEALTNVRKHAPGAAVQVDVRYDADGSLDGSFASAGKFTTDFFSRFDELLGLAQRVADSHRVPEEHPGRRLDEPVDRHQWPFVGLDRLPSRSRAPRALRHAHDLRRAVAGAVVVGAGGARKAGRRAINSVTAPSSSMTIKAA